MVILGVAVCVMAIALMMCYVYTYGYESGKSDAEAGEEEFNSLADILKRSLRSE